MQANKQASPIRAYEHQLFLLQTKNLAVLFSAVKCFADELTFCLGVDALVLG